MRARAAALLLAATSPALLAATPARAPAPPGFEVLEPGLDLGTFDGPRPVPGDGRIVVVRVDPARFALRLLNATAPGEGVSRTARAWAERAGAAAAINASMYQEDYRTSVSLMRTRGHVNQRRLSRDRTVLAFDPLDRKLPAVRLLDRDCDDVEGALPAYASAVQSIRLVSCDGRNVWAPSPRRHSTALVGVDREGRVLFVHARSPWPVHELVNALLALPIGLSRAMYTEGGVEAQLYVRSGARAHEFVGAFEAAPEANREAWPVPNVLAAVRRQGRK